MWVLTAFSRCPTAPSQLSASMTVAPGQQLLAGGEAGLQLGGPNPEAKTLSPAHSVPWQSGGPPQRWDREARGSVIGYPTQVLTIRDPQRGPHPDRWTDRQTLQVKSDDLYFLETLSGTQSKHTQGHHSGWWTASVCPPDSQLRATTHSPASTGAGCAAACHHLGTAQKAEKRGGGQPWARRHPESKGSCCAGRAGFGMWATSGLCLPDPPPHLPDYPLQNENQTSIPVSQWFQCSFPSVQM